MGLSIESLKALSSDVIKQHQPMMSLYQTMAENFYPERADFTVARNIGSEFADILVDSNPVLMRRDLGDSLSSMLRDGEWFNIGTSGEATHDGKSWLEWATGGLRSLMDNRLSNFTGATKEADHDFVTFGVPVISVEVNKKANGLLYRTWHLRDCSWFDDESGQISGVVRSWSPTYKMMVDIFGDNVHSKIKEDMTKNAFKLGKVRHVVLPIDMCEESEYMERGFKFVSYFIDIENDHIIEEKPLNTNMYVIPRFKRFPSTQFAYSPATSTGLPDARTGQTMQHTLLEVAERYARPPIIATQAAIRGDIDLGSDGITYVDEKYDEKMGASLRTLSQDKSGYPIGLDARQDVRSSLASAFYANRLALPETTHEMTAYEVSVRMKQYRRENLPLFQPIEEEYNGQLCEKSFEIAMAAGFFGSPQDIPESLQGHDIKFEFISPLTESEDEKRVSQFQTVLGLAKEAQPLSQTIASNINWDKALKDAVKGSGAPESWSNSEEVVAKAKESVVAMQLAEAASKMPQQAEGS